MTSYYFLLQIHDPNDQWFFPTQRRIETDTAILTPVCHQNLWYHSLIQRHSSGLTFRPFWTSCGRKKPFYSTQHPQSLKCAALVILPIHLLASVSAITIRQLAGNRYVASMNRDSQVQTLTTAIPDISRGVLAKHEVSVSLN